jgi:NAD(P)-dependent dehydrogenase (short-subunit alcohol dehydrogenase family)
LWPRGSKLRSPLIISQAAAKKGIPAAEYASMRAKAHPLGKVGKPEDVASAIVFLASPSAAFITGECFLIVSLHGPAGWLFPICC